MPGPGVVTEKVHRLYLDTVTGNLPDKYNWLSQVYE